MNLKYALFGARSGERMGKTIARNAFWLAFGDAANRILKFILIAYTTRVFVVEEFGAFTFSLNLLALTFIVGDLGISNVLYRKFAKEEDSRYLTASLYSTLGLLAMSVVITLIAARASDPRVATIACILIGMRLFDALKTLLLTVHAARNRMDKQAIANTLETLVTVVGGLLVLFSAPSLASFAWMYTLGALVAFFYTLGTLREYWSALIVVPSRDHMRTIFRISLPLALGGIVWGMIHTTDSLLLGWIKGLETVGFYNAALKITQLLGPLGTIIIGAAFPSLVSTENDPNRHRRLFQRINETLCAFTIPLVVGGIIVGEALLARIYGENYGLASSVLNILLLNFFCGATVYFLTQLFFVHNDQTRSLLYIASGLTLNILFDIILIPTYGMMGAAYAGLIGQTFMLYLHARYSYTHYKLSVLSKELYKPVFAAAVMAATLWSIRATMHSIFVSIPLGATVYATTFLALRPKLIAEIKNIFHRVASNPSIEAGTFHE